MIQPTPRERALEEALLEYVRRYGLTDKARAVYGLAKSCLLAL